MKNPLPVVGWPNNNAPRPSSGGGRRRGSAPVRGSSFNSVYIVPAPERELSSELHYSGVSRRGLFSKDIRLGLYTCILYVCIYTHTHTYIYGFLVCRYARSPGLAARQNTPAIDAAIYRPNGTSYQLQLSFHTSWTEPEPTARARRAGEEFY